MIRLRDRRYIGSRRFDHFSAEWGVQRGREGQAKGGKRREAVANLLRLGRRSFPGAEGNTHD